MKAFCHYCQRQLQFKAGGGQYGVPMFIPKDGYLVKVHMACEDKALVDGYMKPDPSEQTKALARIRRGYRIPGD